MARMRSRVITFVVLLLVAILPIRAVAAAMPSFCAGGHVQAELQAHDHGATQYYENEGSTGELNHDCGFCAKHCHGASFVLASDRPSVFVRPTIDAVPFDAWRAAGFVPDHLDRPPLAS